MWGRASTRLQLTRRGPSGKPTPSLLGLLPSFLPSFLPAPCSSRSGKPTLSQQTSEGGWHKCSTGFWRPPCDNFGLQPDLGRLLRTLLDRPPHPPCALLTRLRFLDGLLRRLLDKRPRSPFAFGNLTKRRPPHPPVRIVSKAHMSPARRAGQARPTHPPSRQAVFLQIR